MRERERETREEVKWCVGGLTYLILVWFGLVWFVSGLVGVGLSNP